MNVKARLDAISLHTGFLYVECGKFVPFKGELKYFSISFSLLHVMTLAFSQILFSPHPAEADKRDYREISASIFSPSVFLPHDVPGTYRW